MRTFHSYNNGRLEAKEGEIVREFPLVLHVNGREIATLIASPHDLRFLVAGFLRLQGFVSSVNDFHLLSVCDDFGIANVRIKGELPERLKPILTSGCGTGITFALPTVDGEAVAPVKRPVAPGAIFRLMEELARRADGYRSHGGIHSAAVGDAEGKLVLYAEDLGRHNTLDRIAGEALLKGIDLAGMMLVTSGRVSTEMAGKAARLGLSVIASRTSPTDMTVSMCAAAGITLAGYVRGGRFTLYSEADGISLPQAREASELLKADIDAPSVSAVAPGRRHAAVTGVILAGGTSSRMGSNKALLPYRGGRFIEAIHRQMSACFDEVIVVTNNPEQYEFLDTPMVPDLFPGMGALAGLHAGLTHSRTPYIFAVACDMPYLHDPLIDRLAALANGDSDVIIAESPRGLEPLHALYSRSCLEPMARSLSGGRQRIMDFFPQVRVHRVPQAEVALLDPEGRSFSNINTPRDYFALRGVERDHLPLSGDIAESRQVAR